MEFYADCTDSVVSFEYQVLSADGAELKVQVEYIDRAYVPDSIEG